MGGDEGRELRGADDGDQGLEDAAGGVRVEVAGGLVGEQQARRIGDRAGDGDALLLAAGEFAGAMIEALAEAEEGQELAWRDPAPPPSTGRG